MDTRWQLVEAHQDVIRRAACKYARPPIHEAEDLFQVAALRVATSRVIPRNGHDPAPLIYRTAASACIDALRREYGRTPRCGRRRFCQAQISLDAPLSDYADLDLRGTLPDSAADPACALDQEEQQTLILRLLSLLTDPQRCDIRETIIEGRGIHEAGRRRGVSGSAVSFSRSRGLRTLARLYRHAA